MVCGSNSPRCAAELATDHNPRSHGAVDRGGVEIGARAVRGRFIGARTVLGFAGGTRHGP